MNNGLNQIYDFAFEALNSANDGITIVDINKEHQPLIYINKSFEKLTGYHADEVIGKNCRFLQGSLPTQVQSALIRDAIKQQQSCRIILKNIKKDGTEFWNELSLAPIRQVDKDVSFYIGIQKDVTNKLMFNQSLLDILEKNKTDAMHVAISHLSDKLAQPLTAISIYSRACCLFMENQNKEIAEKETLFNPLKKIEAQSLIFKEIMTTMNNNFNELDVTIEQLDINSLITQCVNILKYTFSPDIQLRLDSALPKFKIHCDHLTQIILNLIRNSLEAFQRSFISNGQIIIKTTKYEHFIELVISDNGPGMPQEYSKHEPPPFFTLKQCGIGTGFEICRKLIGMYKGSIYFQENNPGLNVIIQLPIS